MAIWKNSRRGAYDRAPDTATIPPARVMCGKSALGLDPTPGFPYQTPSAPPQIRLGLCVFVVMVVRTARQLPTPSRA